MIAKEATYRIEIVVKQLRQALKYIKCNGLQNGHYLHVVPCNTHMHGHIHK